MRKIASAIAQVQPWSEHKRKVCHGSLRFTHGLRYAQRSLLWAAR